MTRFVYIASSLLMVIALSSCQTIQFNRPTFTSDQDWLVDGYSQNRSRSVSEGFTLPLTQVWEYNAAAGFGPGSPLVLDKVVLVSTRKGEIHSIELETGRKRGFRSFGDGIEGAPAIQNGHMFVASALGKRILSSFNLKTGGYAWRNKGVPIESGIVVSDGLIVAADVFGGIKAYDTKTGAEVWSVTIGERVSVQSALLLTDSTSVFVADDSGVASLLSLEDGTVKWQTKLDGPVYEGSSALGSLVVVPTTRGSFHVLDRKSGNVQWSFTTESDVVRFGATSISEDLIVVGASDETVRAFDPETGELKWETHFPDVVSAAPLITQSHIFVGTLGQQLFALNRVSGEIEWETEMRGRIKSAMSLVGGGLLVLSEPRYVTYFKPEGGRSNASN